MLVSWLPPVRGECLTWRLGTLAVSSGGLLLSQPGQAAGQACTSNRPLSATTFDEAEARPAMMAG
jgi:hypothetical protein